MEIGITEIGKYQVLTNNLTFRAFEVFITSAFINSRKVARKVKMSKPKIRGQSEMTKKLPKRLSFISFLESKIMINTIFI